MPASMYFSADVLADKALAAGDITHQAIAHRIGVRESTIYRLLAGRTTPTLETACRIARAYGTSLDDLVPAHTEVAA